MSEFDALSLLLKQRQEQEEAQEERFREVFGSLQELGVLPVYEAETSQVKVEPDINVKPQRRVSMTGDVLPVLNRILVVLEEDREAAASLRGLERAVLERLLARLND